MQYSRALAIFEQYYQYEEIEGYERERKELVPREAFREALANAMIHRVWDVNSYIQISMYDPKIEISSPGGLPGGLSRTEYLHNNISVLRNPIIAGLVKDEIEDHSDAEQSHEQKFDPKTGTRPRNDLSDIVTKRGNTFPLTNPDKGYTVCS